MEKFRPYLRQLQIAEKRATLKSLALSLVSINALMEPSHPRRRSHGGSRRNRGNGKDRVRRSLSALLSVFFLLVNFLVVFLLLREDPLILAVAVFIGSGVGYTFGRKAQRAISRTHGVVQGHAAAEVGTYGNLLILILSGTFFIFEFSRALLYGEINLF